MRYLLLILLAALWSIHGIREYNTWDLEDLRIQTDTVQVVEGSITDMAMSTTGYRKLFSVHKKTIGYLSLRVFQPREQTDYLLIIPEDLELPVSLKPGHAIRAKIGKSQYGWALLDLDFAWNQAAKTYSDMLTAINAIVVVLILAAGILAFVVLYNLTNINVCERIKEIATLKVLGFYQSETAAYVFRETIILSLLGGLVGLGAGIFLERFVVLAAEVDMVMFGREIKPDSFAWSLALTMVFACVVSLAMNKRLKNISMVESMKAPE